MNSDTTKIWQKIGELDNRSKSAHHRLDEVRREMRDDFKVINNGIGEIKALLKDEIENIQKEMKVVNTWINEKKGMNRALLFVGGVAGSGLALIAKYVIDKFL